jgi:AraC-binding-like domain
MCPVIEAYPQETGQATLARHALDGTLCCIAPTQDRITTIPTCTDRAAANHRLVKRSNLAISKVLTPLRPLDNFPLVRTSKIEDTREALARVYAKPALEVARGCSDLVSSINNCQLRHVGLAYGSFGAAVRLEFPATGFFSILFPVHGKGEIISGKTLVSLTVGSSATISQDMGHVASYSADYQYLVLRIDAQALTKKLESITGATIDEPLQVAPRQDLRQPAAQMLQKYLPLLVDTLSAAHPPFPDWWISQTEQLLMTLFLCGHSHNYSHLLERGPPNAAPWQVQQAEDYIEANWQRAITLEDLAQVTGVSAFSLFRSFKKSRGYSPSEFLAQLRSRQGSTL